ncbi:MAG: hypothetical protein GVY07_01240 [Bacteroidetes bacterium]|jgi:hypothetical protein|nr:hypothetical protein [Bacteroidota bacterium]
MKQSFSNRGIKVVGITLLIYAILVAPHEGEFWPMSIYPMFSQAGNPWTRAMVLDVTELPETERWQQRQLQQLDTDVVAVGSHGVDQIDFSNFVSKTDNWDRERQRALISMFGSETIGSRRWMVSKVRGELIGEDSVSIQIEPFIMITSDSTFTNPNLPESAYREGS